MTQGRIRVLALMISDMLCMSIVWAVVVNVYKWFGFGHYHASAYWNAWPAVLVFVLINSLFRLYHGNPFYPSVALSPVEEFRRLVGSALGVHVLVMAVLGFRQESEAISRFVLVTSAIGVCVFAQFFRNGVRYLLFRIRVGQIPVLIVGSGRITEALVADLQANPHQGLRPILFTGDNHEIVAAARRKDIKILISTQDIRLLREEMGTLVQWFQQIAYLPEREAFPILGSRPIRLGDHGGLEMVNQRRLRGLQIEKRLVDTMLAMVIGFVTLPFFVVVPILIKLTSRGPVIYKAKRLGKKGRTIYVWKFRSMYADADKRLQTLLDSDPALKAEFEKDFKLKNDPRVTPLGKFLRKTSIDELPQLWNVIRGEMALVGPRPIVEAEVAYYGADYEIFSLVKPGITGLWQCSGRSNADYAQRVALDKFYVLNWSPWMDLWIVLRTIVAVVGMRGSC